MTLGRGIAQRHYFCMRTAGLLGVAVPDDMAIGRDQDAANTRIRVG